MKLLLILQWGKERSIVQVQYPEKNEVSFMIMDNDYLMILDDMNLIKNPFD